MWGPELRLGSTWCHGLAPEGPRSWEKERWSSRTRLSGVLRAARNSSGPRGNRRFSLKSISRTNPNIAKRASVNARSAPPRHENVSRLRRSARFAARTRQYRSALHRVGRSCVVTASICASTPELPARSDHPSFHRCGAPASYTTSMGLSASIFRGLFHTAPILDAVCFFVLVSRCRTVMCARFWRSAVAAAEQMCRLPAGTNHQELL